jgi:hypothetical protein
VTRPRTFALIRDTDVSGISGPGHVADGIKWADGSASVRWLGEHPSIVHWASFASVDAIHGHGGSTRIVWDIDRLVPPDLEAVQRRVGDCAQAEAEHWDTDPTIQALWSSVQDIQPLMAEVARLRAPETPGP